MSSGGLLGNHINHLNNKLERKLKDIQLVKLDISTQNEKLKKLKRILIKHRKQGDKIKHDINHPHVYLYAYLSSDVVKICLDYLPTWCNKHTDFYHGSHCIHCLLPGKEFETHGKRCSKYTLDGNAILIGHLACKRRSNNEYYLIGSCNPSDVDLFKEWNKGIHDTDNLDCDCFPNSSRLKITHNFGKNGAMDYLEMDPDYIGKTIPAGTQIYYYSFNYCESDYGWDAICANATGEIVIDMPF